MLYAKVDTAASGDTTIVSAVSGKKIRVVGYVLVAAGAVTVQWKDATATYSGAMSLITGTRSLSDGGHTYLRVGGERTW